MQKIKFKEKCPYEVGDKIQFEKGGAVNTMTITDILVEYSVKNETAKFKLELDGWYMLDTSRHEVKIPER